MGVEFELKFEAQPGQLEEIRQAYPEEYRQYRMRTTYYDTPSGALSARHITLRCRLENDEAVCTVKTPIAGYGRGEWDCRCEDIRQAIPLLIAQGAPRVLAELTKEGLREVCGARFTRQAVQLEYEGTTLELALDQGILTGGGREVPLCEVEVELKSGEPEVAIAFGMRLRSKFALVSQKKSKFRRALDLTQGG